MYTLCGQLMDHRSWNTAINRLMFELCPSGRETGSAGRYEAVARSVWHRRGPGISTMAIQFLQRQRWTIMPAVEKRLLASVRSKWSRQHCTEHSQPYYDRSSQQHSTSRSVRVVNSI
jgi:hypothetical protein